MSAPRWTQRWSARSARWRPAGEGGFDPDRYDVVPIAEQTAADYLLAEHYARSMPSTSYRYGLIDHGDGAPRLVGVATLGVPMSAKTLTNPFPNLEPYTESIEFNRLCLHDAVRANGESFFSSRVFGHAARHHGVRGILTFADPLPRWRTVGGPAELVKPGHWGVLYQALNFEAAGRSTPRTLVMLPDASVLTARAIAKITGRESGHRGVIARLVALGATDPQPDTDLRDWIAGALRQVHARRVRHPGNYRYLLKVGTRAQRSRTVIGLTTGRYPKPDQQLTLTGPTAA
jgi:hypothetical protein